MKKYLGLLLMGLMMEPEIEMRRPLQRPDTSKIKNCGWCGAITTHPNGACSAEHFKLWKASGFRKNHGDPT